MHPLSNVLDQVIRAEDAPGEIREYRFFRDWPLIVGRPIAEQTVPLKFLKKKLILGTKNSSWAHSLRWHVDELQEKIQKHLRFIELKKIEIVLLPQADFEYQYKLFEQARQGFEKMEDQTKIVLEPFEMDQLINPHVQAWVSQKLELVQDSELKEQLRHFGFQVIARFQKKRQILQQALIFMLLQVLLSCTYRLVPEYGQADVLWSKAGPDQASKLANKLPQNSSPLRFRVPALALAWGALEDEGACLTAVGRLKAALSSKLHRVEQWDLVEAQSRENFRLVLWVKNCAMESSRDIQTRLNFQLGPNEFLWRDYLPAYQAQLSVFLGIQRPDQDPILNRFEWSDGQNFQINVYDPSWSLPAFTSGEQLDPQDPNARAVKPEGPIQNQSSFTQNYGGNHYMQRHYGLFEEIHKDQVENWSELAFNHLIQTVKWEKL